MKPKRLSRETQKFSVTKYSNSGCKEEQISVVTERPFRILVNEETIATIMITPAFLEEFLMGFLVGQGVIKSISQVQKILIEAERKILWAKISKPAKIDLTKTLVTSGCSGGLSFENFTGLKSFDSIELTPDVKVISKLMKKMISGGGVYKEAGGVHSAALIDKKNIIFKVEDIGRHNAIDKAIGYLAKNNINPKGKMILTTGRLSLEAIPKVARAGIKTIGSCSTPTDLAIELARKLNILLLGYIRAGKMTVY